MDIDLGRLERYMRENFSACVLMPACDNGKAPRWPHKHGQYTWDTWAGARGAVCVREKTDGVDGCLLRLTEGLIVVDVDCKDLATALEEQGLGFECTAACATRKGQHFYFRHTSQCDAAGMYDGARQFGADLDIDLKTCRDHRTSGPEGGKCPGTISVPPSSGKTWIRPPWDYDILPMPSTFVDFFLASKHGGPNRTRTSATSTCGPEFIPLATLRRVVLELLSDRRAHDYATWRPVVFAINNVCHECGHSNQDRDDLIHAFSERDPAKYDRTRVSRYIQSLVPNAAGNRFGTLGAMAKEDSPVGWQNLQAAALETQEAGRKETPQLIEPQDVRCVAEAIMSFLGIDLDSSQVISACVCERACSSSNSISSSNFNSDSHTPTPTKRNSGLMQSQHDWTGKVLHIQILQTQTQTQQTDAIMLDLDTLEVSLNGVSAGYLHHGKGIPITGWDFAAINEHFRPGMQWLTTRPSHEKLKFMTQEPSPGPRAHIEIVNYHNPEARSAKVSLPDMNKTSTITAPKKLNMLDAAYASSIRSVLTTTLGLNKVLLVAHNMQVTILQDRPSCRENGGRHDDDMLIEALLCTYPEIKRRWRFSPDVTSANYNGIFHCDPVTNVWTKEHNAYVEEELAKAFKEMTRVHAGPQGDLTVDDRKYLQSRHGSTEMRLMLVRKVLEKSFSEKLDENLDVFVVRNGLFDMREKVFRQIVPEDMVSTHADWDYDKGLASSKRPELDAFLSQVLPVDEERRIFLTYMAGLLSGRRCIKKFIVLTDRRAGNNGKSTLSRLFRLFFGTYTKASTKFVCRGSFDRDRDSHDAGLEPFKGKRILIAEELKKSMTLDVAMLKAYTGGVGERVEGRKCGAGDWFNFTWQAGFMLIFNEGDAPSFDTTDEAFLGRMVVVPMRSKFVPVSEPSPSTTTADATDNPELEEEFTFPMNKDVGARFQEWLPALADVLMEAYNPDGLDIIPTSMREWRADIADASNSIAEWLDDIVSITGNKKDVLPIKDVHRRYLEYVRNDCATGFEAGRQHRDTASNLTKDQFTQAVRSYMANKREAGVLVKDRHCWRDAADKKQCTARQVIVGAVMCNQEEHECMAVV
ncbi:hypothetical protein PLESTB_001803800 [Pleodorina starrii]|uniref:Bacteriophage/plasmid primase P4 C-terminal domain-containing protein n=1 Tax=Pleodorina starrii TaxID=330485 RepID=A0A9W6C112_9CHLO|nr:hypothetical protein PLESTM_001051000 [Pleodorina starrii]GLC61789.1 hypothetical protein PLESTB_001803300 [Pleodorina starrii]GLC61793.1 hypothetical protein PLESTB_001803800 [Pleodorina starrii]GLC70463.1 hypothetical protein PLESTF_000984500 [Pleodorina starrii]